MFQVFPNGKGFHHQNRQNINTKHDKMRHCVTISDIAPHSLFLDKNNISDSFVYYIILCPQ